MRTYQLKVDCSTPGCEHQEVLEVGANRYDMWMSRGVPVQTVWPELSPEDREIIIADRTGNWICPDCWDLYFAEPPEDMEEAEWKR